MMEKYRQSQIDVIGELNAQRKHYQSDKGKRTSVYSVRSHQQRQRIVNFEVVGLIELDFRNRRD